MINKLVVDGHNITLNESTVLPFTYTFSTSGVHNVRVGLDNTNEICAYAFKDCTELTRVVNIPENITMIKRNAFENCSSLKKMNIPSSIEYVGPNVFDGCASLEELKFESTTPPRFFTTLSDFTNCYIPDYSKFIKVEDNSELVKDGSIQYYEKNVLGGYDEVDYEALEDEGEYYYDNWTSVHDHYNVIEERFRVKPTQIQFMDEDVVVTSYGTINSGDSGQIRPHRLLPENTTNDKVYFYSTNENILQVDQTGHFTTNAYLQGNARVNVCACTEPDYNGTYAFTSLSFTVRASQVTPPINTMTLTFDQPAIESDYNVGDIVEFNVPTLTGDNSIVDPEIIYSSSDEGVAKFESGELIIVGEGVTTITATYMGDDTHTRAEASFELTVNIIAAEKQNVHLSFETEEYNITTVVGTEYQLADLTQLAQQATCDYEGAEITYSVDYNDVLTIEDNVATVNQSGTIIITASFAGDDTHNSATAQYRIVVTATEPEPQTFTVKFMDGDEVLREITGPTGTPVSASIDVTKEGYEFNGWSINGTTPILPVDAITDTDITYVALWIEAQPEEPATPVYLIPTTTKPTAESIGEMSFPEEKPTEGQTLETSEITRPTELYLVYPSSWVTADEHDNITNPVITDPNGFAQGAWIDSTIIIDSIEYIIIGTELGLDNYTVTFN